MATGTAQTDSSRTPAANQAAPNPFDRVIKQQLDRTRAYVKYVDLIGSLMVLGVGWLSFLLVVSVIDHWVVPLGFWGRLVTLLTFIGGTATYCARVIGPLLWRRVNPVYAARVIEESQPTLKNSLINFLMFRADPTPGRQLVYQALQQQAAADLTRVPIDTAVDRSQAIRIGYVLTAVLAVCALYKILSPKDPFQTFSRVAAPWADIARPARVTIRNVEPGDRTVFHGQTVTVSAEVLGTRSAEPVTLVYSTADGQVVDRPLEMQPSEAGLRYEAKLPAGGGGIDQGLDYHIVAGDAVTKSWRLEVLPAPTILVDRLEYEFPAYTKRTKQTIEQQGDIQALEGTRVTVHARANQPIASAAIDFDATGEPTRDSLTMEFEAQQAHRDFVLLLNTDKTPWHASYQVRFKTQAGDTSQFPVSHRIEVLRDLAPEIEILTPRLERIELPEDSRQPIEVRALDPDYALTKIGLKAVSGGSELLTLDLLNDPQGRTGQVVQTYDLVPAALDLHAGDEVVFWAVAEDNRTAPQTGKLEPNSRRTGRYQITITAAESGEAPTPNAAAPPAPSPDKGPKPKQQPPGQKSIRKDRQPKDKPETRKPDDQPPDQPDQDPDQAVDKNQAADQQPQPKPQEGESGGNGSGESGGQSSTTQSSKTDSKSGEQSGAEGQQDGSGGEGTEGAPSENRGASSGQAGASNGPGSSSADRTPADGVQQRPSDGPREEPLHDGEAVEKALEHLREQQGKQPAEPPSGDPEQTGQGGQQAEGGQQTGESNDAGAPQTSQGDEARGDSGARPKSPNSASDEPLGSERTEQPKGGQNGTSKRAGEKDQKQAGQKGADRKGAGDPPPDRSPSAGAPQGESSGGQKDRGADDVPEQGPASNSGTTAEQPGQRAPGGTPRPDEKLGEGQQQPDQPGEGGNPTADKERPENQGTERQDPTGGQQQAPGLGDNGRSGAGQQSQDQSGSPESQGENRDRDKHSQEDDPGQQKSQGAQSPSNSPRQSDSKGGQEGDRSGGGGKGGGQGANQQGNDSAGSNSAADEGAGAAKEKGAGETGSRPGQDKQAGGETGSSGTEKGAGSRTQAGDQASGGAGERPSPEETQQGSAGGSKSGAGKGGNPVGGGLPGDSTNTGAAPPSRDVPDGQDPNLDYARKATEMVLEHLENQKDDPDPALLKKLGWTKEELQKFLKRWQALKNSSDSDNGKRQWNEAVRSLGLRPEGTAVRRGAQRGDEVRGLRDSGERFNPPPGQLQKYNAYRRSVSRAATKDSE